MDEIKKVYFSISEVSEIVKLKPYVLRYWEKEFIQLKPLKNNANVRKYVERDIQLILKLKDLLYKKKYTIKGAKAFLSTSTTIDTINNMEKEKLIEIKYKIEKLIQFLNN